MTARKVWRLLPLGLLAGLLFFLGIGRVEAQYVASPAPAQVFSGGSVHVIVRQSDGKVIVGGTFIAINGVSRNRIARLNADGSLDATWNPDANATVEALTLDGSGNVYVGGQFSSIGGQSRNRIAKLSTSGTGAADATWNPNASNTVYALTVDAGSNVIAGGDFTTIGGQARNRIAKLAGSGTGAADATWDPNASSTVYALTVDAGSNVIAGGDFTTIGGQARNRIALLAGSGAGAADATWDPNANSTVYALTVNAGSNVLAGGNFTTIGGQARNRIALLAGSGAGAADAAWDPNGDGTVRALVRDGSGNAYAGGNFTSIGGQSRNRVAKLSASGTGAADASWNPNVDALVYALALDGSGNIHVGGDLTTVGGQSRSGFATLTTAGALDPAWSLWTQSAGTVNAIARDVDGRTIIGGAFTMLSDGTARNRIARLNADGSVDTTWNPNAGNTVFALAVDGSGNIYAGGNFTSIGGQTRNRIAKLSGSGAGAADAAWDSNASGNVLTLAIDGSSNVYAGGNFSSIGGQARNRIAKLSGSGTGAADATWNPNAGSTVNALAVDSSGNVYAGGIFNSIGGQSRNRIAKLSTSGTGAADATWDPNSDNTVNALALDGSGNLYAGGLFTSIGGQSRNRIAKLSTSGTGAADASWNPNAANTVNALALDGSGNVHAGGIFTSIGGQSRNRIAKLSSSGTGAADATWDPNANNTVSALVGDGSGVHAGGIFTSIGGQNRAAYAKLLPLGAPDAPTGVSAVASGATQVTVTFTVPVLNGGAAITGYTATASPAGGVDGNAGTTGLSHVITGLTVGVTYTFTVTALNANGTSAASAASNSVTLSSPVVAIVPGAPTIGKATAGDAQATISFTPPASDGNSSIIGYTVSANPPGGVDSQADSTSTSRVITGLTNYTAYTFTVTARNGVGTGPASAPSNSVTPAAVAPVCTLAASPAKIAVDRFSVLTASCTPAATSYAWTNVGFDAVVASGAVAPGTTTTYAVTGSNTAGTGNTAVVTVTVQLPVSTTAPQCTLTASPFSIGRGGSTYLFARCSPTATSHVWTNSGFAASSSGGKVKPITTTTYSVTGSNAQGSGNTANATVLVSDILSSVAPALFVNASTSNNKTSAIRIINTADKASVVSATAFDESGNLLGNPNATLGLIQANQTLTFSSADLEQLIEFTPSTPTAKYTVYFSADLPTLPIINYTRDNASGALTLAQSVHTGRSNATAAGVTRSAWLVHSSSSVAKSSVVRLVNTSDQSGTLNSTLFDEFTGAVGAAGTPVAIAPRQMISYTSAELENAFGFQPSATGKYRVTFTADLPSLELINFSRNPDRGTVSLAQAQIDDRPASSVTTSIRNVLSVIAASHPTSTTSLRIINPNPADAAITVVAYDEVGAVLGSGALGRVTGTQTLTLDSSQIEASLGYRPASPMALTRLVLSANVPSFEVLNHNRLRADGSLSLAQAQTDNRTAGTATTTIRHAYIVYPSTHAVNTTELRLINLGTQTATLTATAYADSGTLIGSQEIGVLRSKEMLTLSSAQLERVFEYLPASNTISRVVFSGSLPDFDVINYARDVTTGNLILAQPQTE